MLEEVEHALSYDGAPIVTELGGIVRILTCGSVDDGKSTLIGRLLWESPDLPSDQREMVLTAARTSGSPEILDTSMLLDGLVAEREQGITIDVAWRYIDTAHRRLVIIDSPGHEQYTRNMASGASHADAAIILVDARHGLKRQTFRHAAILDLMGVRRVVLAINKMDLVDWDEKRFRTIEREFLQAIKTFGFIEASAIPVSARLGDNVTNASANMAWFQGPTLVSKLEHVSSRQATGQRPFRMPVQTVLRNGQDFRALAGSVASGAVSVGDRVTDVSSGKSASVARIVTMGGDLKRAEAGQAVAVLLDTDLDISRGSVLSHEDGPPILARRIEARCVWLADTALNGSEDLLLRTATDLVPITSMEVDARFDLDDLSFAPHDRCETNDVVSVSLDLARPTALDRFADHQATGSFLLVDRRSGATLAGGIAIKVEARAQQAAEGRPVFKLTEAMLSNGLCSDLGSSKKDRNELSRRAREVERLLEHAGVAVELEPIDA